MGCLGERHVTGITAVLPGIGGLTVGTVALSNSNAYRGVIDPNIATATYSLNSDGSLTSTGNAGGFWVTPQVGMDLFEVRAILNAGTLTSGALNTWVPLSVSRAWVNTQDTGQGAVTANLTIQIRRTGDSVVLASATVNISAEVFAL